MIQNIKTLLYDEKGPLTRDLLQQPGDYGLGNIPERLKPDRIARSICGYCSTGCRLNIHMQNGKAINLSPDTDYPVNLGMACPKGWEALSVMESPDRGTTPLLKNEQGERQPIPWQTAIDTFATKMKAIQKKHGKEAIAFISTGQLPSEEMALLGAVSKFGMDMLHGDGNTRQCMATAVTAYKESFGFDAPPYSYQDFSESDVLLFIGANPCIAHPIMWERVCQNPHSPEIIVIDPRSTETAQAATQHLALKPKSDLSLFYALAAWLIQNDGIDPTYIDAHTEHFDAFKKFLAPYSLPLAAEKTSIPLETLEHCAHTIKSGKRVSFWWTMGVNQNHEGTRIAQAIINLALMTGNIGRPGTGANSITGQCNAMGSRLWSNTTNLLGGRKFTDPQDRADVAKILDIPIENIPTQDSLPYHKILEEVEAGNIRGLWILCTNPAHSWIQQKRFEALRQKLDFLVVQDIYHSTETAVTADLFLPAAGWGEKEGTFINSERRYGLIQKIRKAPGQALSDFHIIKLLAQAWGCAELFKDWTSPEAVFQLLKKLSNNSPCDITGIQDYAMLEKKGGIQWPLRDPTEISETNERRLFADGQYYTPNDRARFIFEAPRNPPEQPDNDYPYILLTGRGSASQWHTQTRTSKSAVLKKLYPNEIYIEINPNDAAALHIQPDHWVQISTRRGCVKARAYLTPIVQPGQLFMPMHYKETNDLTLAHFDPYSHQPSYKYATANIQPTTL